MPDGSHVNVVRDHVFESLFAPVPEEMEGFSKDALQAYCTSILTVVKKRFADFLEGGKYREVSEQAREETKDMLKSNKIGENDFGCWAYLKRIKPSSGIMTTEGIIMYRRNFTGGLVR